MERAKRAPWRFSSIFWRVTLSYVLVTFVAVLTIEVATTISQFLKSTPPSASVSLLELLEQREAPQVALSLEQARPDQEILQRWLSGPLFTAIGKAQPAFIALVDRQGHALAATVCDATKSPTSGTDHCIAADATQAMALLAPSSIQATLFAALVGTSSSIDASHQEKQTIIGVPVRGYDQQVRGAIVTAIQGALEIETSQANSLRNVGELASLLLRNLQLTAVYSVLLATGIGTIVGVSTFRGVTRRLRRITQAAKAWSNGEFAIVVRDSSRDEIGQLAQDLNSMATQIQALLNVRQELAVLEERNRLARDLHDSVKQHLFANALLVNAAHNLLEQHPEQVGAHLLEAEHLAQLAQDELATVIQALRPAALDDKGLVAVVQEYTTEWSARMGITVVLEVSGERALPLSSEETLLRVMQEALANVARHSGATQVRVTLVWHADEIRMEIVDNGHGFQIQRELPGVGLKSMRERVEAVRGTLAVNSAPNGTTIVASIPLRAARLAMQAQAEPSGTPRL